MHYKNLVHFVFKCQTVPLQRKAEHVGWTFEILLQILDRLQFSAKVELWFHTRSFKSAHLKRKCNKIVCVIGELEDGDDVIAFYYSQTLWEDTQTKHRRWSESGSHNLSHLLNLCKCCLLDHVG